MAYAVLVSLAQTIDEILNHHHCISISLLQSQQMISIHEYVIFLQVLLEDFPEKVNSDLEGKITAVSTEAADVIEYFMLKQFETSGIRQEHQDLDELERLSKEFDSIAGEAMHVLRNEDIRTSVDSPAAGSAIPSARLAPSHKKDAMVGFDDDLLAIQERLCGESKKLQVIPIVGMGGIGKTTLASNAYHHPLITGHFDIRVWVTVSQDYSPQSILSSLLDSMKESYTERRGQNSEVAVHQRLKGRRYLIVMDDIWSTKAWDDVRRIFPDDNNGSRIMLTTRLLDVAAYADSCSRIHEMQLMDAEQSWDLLHHKVFRHGERRCTLELENIGKEIARSCRGLPLATVVIAGLLSTSITRASWQKIADNVKSAISSTKDGQVEKILSLSYTHLPHHLRPCFLYIGGFPEDYEINVSKLIKLWVAEGFLKYSNGSKSYEEVAEEYLEDLVKRGLISVNRMKSNGKIKSCSVHDLVRDFLCVRKSKEVRFFNLVYKSNGRISAGSIKYQRRICVTRSDLGNFRLVKILNVVDNYVKSGLGSTLSDLIFPAHIGKEILRTIICFDDTSEILGHLGNFRLLRILDIHTDLGFISIPVEVFKLFQLRYLAFFSFDTIPADISNLQNLQSLIINTSYKTFYFVHDVRHFPEYLPLEIWKMPQLRHLVSPVSLLRFKNEDTSTCALKNLVTLTISVTYEWRMLGMFKMIPNLKKLNIYFREMDSSGYYFDGLVHLHQLEKLTLNIDNPVRCTEKLPLALPKTLKKLTLSGWRIPWDGDAMRRVGSLPNLQVLKLKDSASYGQTWETREGEFSQLKLLLIDDLYIKEWITESSHFPALKCLLLHHCWGLEEIPDGIGEIPTLELIEIDRRNRGLMESAKRIQEEQQAFGNDALQVRFFDLSW